MSAHSTHEGEDLKRALVDLAATVRDDTDNNFLPAIGTPDFRLGPAAQVRDILENTV